jgi:pyroglutamyl-peptidase
MNRKKKILLTGFGPFRLHGTNPSEALVRSLSDTFENCSNIQTLILPTDYKKSWEDLKTALDDFKPDIVLSFGLAARRSHICLESIAYNKASTALADISGYRPEQAMLIENAPSSYHSRLPLKRLEKTLRANGHNVRVSRNAGDYVCNATLFNLLNYAKEKAPEMKSTFVHIPKPRAQGQNTKRSIEEAALALLDNL